MCVYIIHIHITCAGHAQNPVKDGVSAAGRAQNPVTNMKNIHLLRESTEKLKFLETFTNSWKVYKYVDIRRFTLRYVEMRRNS